MRTTAPLLYRTQTRDGPEPGIVEAMAKPRILGGTARGRSLAIPRCGTRPSPSRLREGLFNIFQDRDRGSFLDLFSGSGAVGLEAASRGWRTICVDSSVAATSVIRNNAAALDLEARVVHRDALDFLRTTTELFDVIFSAPPYPSDLNAIFGAIVELEKLQRGGVYVFQHPSRHELDFGPLGAPKGARQYRYGSNAITLIDPQ